jgi:hypothetical protein
MISIRWIQAGLVAAVATAGIVVASADGSGSGGTGGAGSGSGSHPVMDRMFAACAKAKEGDSCQFVGRGDRLVKGTCQVPREGGSKLICKRGTGGGNGDGNGGGGGGGGAGSGSGGKGSGK